MYFGNKKVELEELIQSQSTVMNDQWLEMYLEAASFISLYVGDMVRFKSLSDKFMKGEKSISSLAIESYLVHKQYNWVYKFFTTQTDMIEKYSPLYYATLHLLGDKKQEILKMPPEIKENVEHIIDKVKRLQEYYGA